MATSPMNGIIQHLGKAMILRDGATRTDGQLLSEYVRHQDETALAVLVRRHSPLVWGVCRRIIGNHHDAEDAFQATFLVLVRKAASIASTELLANWLYGVAYKTAMKARATLARRRSREKQVIESAEPAVVEHFLGNDLQSLLDYELSRLPYRYRMVILLCDIEGMTRKDAAQHLHVPEGTVGSSLARAREMLAKRLTQRGVALPAAAMAVVVSQRIALASMRTSFVSLTVRAASQFGAGEVATTGLISLEVAALAAGVLKAMLLNQFKSALAALLLLALVGIGTLAVFASDGIPRVGYQPPEICPAVMSDVIVTRLAEVALDANAGKNSPYFRESDPANINHLWQLRKTGDDYMIVPKVREGKVALDANAGKNNPYFRESDPTNINQLWRFRKTGENYMIVPKVGEGRLALIADEVKGRPYIGKPDAMAKNCLWELRKMGEYYLIVPVVTVPKLLDFHEEIENIVRKARDAGSDRKATLDAIEKTVKELRAKPGS